MDERRTWLRSSMQRTSTNLIGAYAHQSHTGYCPGNPHKSNQDSFIECVGVGPAKEFTLFAVCDGHGYYGGEVSQFVKHSFPVLLSSSPCLLSNPKKALTLTAHRVNAELYNQPFDISLSGTTMVSVLIRGNKLWCANIGDSRALLARLLKPNNSLSQNYRNWMAIALSRDHKASLPEENQRILQQGGRVEAYTDEFGNQLGPARVWLKHESLPGLAMSRSLGDGVCKTVGVVCDPELVEYTVCADDKFVVFVRQELKHAVAA